LSISESSHTINLFLKEKFDISIYQIKGLNIFLALFEYFVCISNKF